MEKETLHAELRPKGGNLKDLRHGGQVPAVLYGSDTKPVSLKIDRKTFNRLYQAVGSSTLVLLAIDNEKPVNVLIHDVQKHPVTDELVHADLLQVKMTEKIRAEIPLEFVGLAPAVEQLEGNLITPRTEIEVECLPDALVGKIEVDVAGLNTFEDVIKVADLKIPAGIEVLTDLEELVAQVTPPRSEEELEAELAEPTAQAEQEAIEKIEKDAQAEKAEGEETGEEASSEDKKEESKEH